MSNRFTMTFFALLCAAAMSAGCSNSDDPSPTPTCTWPEDSEPLECADYAAGARLIGETWVSGFSGSRLAIAGDYLYVVHQSDLTVIDVSDPQDPVKITTLEDLGGDRDVWAHGGYVFVATGGILKVFDVTDPTEPEPAGELAVPCYRICGYGDFLYCVDTKDDRLHIVDVSVPDKPRRYGSVALPGSAQGISVVDGLVAVGCFGHDGIAGAVFVDVTDPIVPRVAGQVQTPYTVPQYADVALAGEYCYYTDAENLHVLDISDPAAPRIVESVELPRQVYGLTLVGDHVVLSGFLAVDVSDPEHPVLAAGAEDQQFAFTNSVYDGAVLFGSTSSRIEIVAPGDFSVVEFRNTYVADAGQLAVRRFDQFHLTTDTEGRLRILDLAEFDSPMLVGEVTLPADGLDVAVGADRAFVACGDEGLQVVDLSDPGTPAIARVVPLLGQARHVVAAGDRAYVAAGIGATTYLHAIELDGTGEGETVETIVLTALSDAAGGLALSCFGGSELLLAALGNEGLVCIDSSSSEPRIVGAWREEGVAVADVSVCDGVAYLSCSGLLIALDVDDPSSPRELSRTAVQGGLAIETYFGRAYLAGGYQDGLQVVDILAPGAVELLGGIRITETTQWVTALDVSEDGVVVTNGYQLRLAHAACLQ